MPVVAGDSKLKSGDKYKNTQAEEFIPLRGLIMKLMKELIPQ